MSHVIAVSNLRPTTGELPDFFGSVPCVGVSDYDSDLCFGANGFTILMVAYAPISNNYNLVPGDLGMPWFEFVDRWISGDNVGLPKSGFTICNMGSGFAPTLAYYNAYDYSDASKYHYAQIAGGSTIYSRWNFVGFVKPANSSTVLTSLNGATPTMYTGGTATAVGTPTQVDIAGGTQFGAKVRYFHTITGTVKQHVAALGNGAMGIFIFNGALTQTQLNAATANLAAFQTAVDTTYLANLVVRSFAGGTDMDWRTLEDTAVLEDAASAEQLAADVGSVQGQAADFSGTITLCETEIEGTGEGGGTTSSRDATEFMDSQYGGVKGDPLNDSEQSWIDAHYNRP